MPRMQAPTNVTMGVVKVVGDGDCLFHALAFFDGSDGGALRIDVADFLEEEAVNQPGFAFEWLDEAEKLRENKWGGHTAIIAFSQMMATRVVLHTRLEDGTVAVALISFTMVRITMTPWSKWPMQVAWKLLGRNHRRRSTWRRKRLRQSFRPYRTAGQRLKLPSQSAKGSVLPGQRRSARRNRSTSSRLSNAANAAAVRRKQSALRSIRSSGAIGDTHRRPHRHRSSETTSSRRCAEYEWPLRRTIHTDSKKISSRTTYA